MDLTTTELFGNTLQTWAIALGTAVGTYVVLRLVIVVAAARLVRALSRDDHFWDDALKAAVQATRTSLLLLFAVFVGSETLTLPDASAGLLRSVAVIVLLVQAGLWGDAGLSRWLDLRGQAEAEDDPARAMSVGILAVMARLVLWSMVLLLALENLGIDVTALVAGLGIGGIAVALAAQNVLGDLFASLSIVLDKPFVLGDFVIVGDFMGSVEAIGLKTTRIRSLSGEQVVFSNEDLLTSRIRNYGRMYQRRVVLKLGVTYQTPREALTDIPAIIRDAIEAHPADKIRFDRAHLDGYGDSAITFEAVYFVLDSDFGLHMDVKQEILLTIHRDFEARGIEYAYPTQTVWVERSGPSRGESLTEA